jgi:hypothetical protein
MAHGPAFQGGARLTDSFSNLDVYPLLARLLGIRPQPHQGRSDTFDKVLTRP